MENAAVLRGVSRAGKTLNSVESFVLEPQYVHFKSMQTQRRASWLAQYQTSLPDKQLLQDKLNEFFELEEQQSEMYRGK